MRNLLFFLAVCCLSQFSYSQSIRKDYREFTQQEINDYVGAINVLYSNGTMLELANHHSNHFESIIHTVVGIPIPTNGEQFLTWHRFNMLDFETLLRNTNSNYSYLTLPYWDWTTDRNTLAPKFWNNDFLALSNFPGSGVIRDIDIDVDGFLGSVTNINDALALSTHFINSTIKSPTVGDFLHRIEYYHDNVHQWVGGTMFSSFSPRDPIFYLHHNYIDSLWQQWEDKNSGNQSSATLTGQANDLIHYTGAPTSGAVLDSRNIPRPPSAGTGRNMDVWFAKSGKVILDGANGTTFIANDVNAPYLYRYTAATTTGASTIVGEMYVGDVKYDSSNNVIIDNKGGFEINSLATCDFRAGKSIIFMPGFVAKNGSNMSGKIITAPNSVRINNIIDAVNNSTTNSLYKDIIRIAPNPNNGIFKINLKDISVGTFQVSNLFGYTVYKLDFKNQNEFEIDMQGSPKGIYIVKVMSGNETFTGKIIKN